MKNDKGSSGAVQQKVHKFFVSIGKEVNCTANTAVQIKIDAKIKCNPFFCFLAQSVRSSSKLILCSHFLLCKIIPKMACPLLLYQVKRKKTILISKIKAISV